MRSDMRRITWCCLAVAVLVSGCTLHYDITTFNGDIIRAASKPKLNERGYFVYKDGLGRAAEINKVRVRKIEVVNPGDPPSRSFN